MTSSQYEQEKVILPLQYEAGVTLKLVQVSVVDRKGNPVKDLTRDDFLVYDNGKRVTLTEYEKHVLGSIPVETQERPAAAKPAQPAPSTAPEMDRKFFFLFDFAFNNDRGVVKAREAALAFMDKNVRPEDDIGILTYSMIKGLRVQEYLTRDHGKVREYIDKISRKDMAGRVNEIEESYYRSLLTASESSDPRNSQKVEGEVGKNTNTSSNYSWQRQEGRRLAEFYIERLNNLALALRQVPGRKYFLFFSSGVPASSIYGLYKQGRSRDESMFDVGDPVLRAKNEAMLREFSASGCTIYSFDTREAAKGADLFAYDEMTFGGYRGLEGSVFSDSTGIFRDEQFTGRNSLQRMSQVTGGEYFGNIDFHDKSFAKVENQTGSFYVLGYPISEKEDGKYHEVRVEVKRPGCKVRGSSGYFSPKPFREFNEQEKMLHLFDLALNESAPSRLPERFPMKVVPVSAGDPAGLLMYGELGAGLTEKLSAGPLELVSVVFDSEDNVLDLQVGRSENAAGSPYLLTSFVPAKPGTYRCRLVVRNMSTGRAAVSSVWKTVMGTAAPGEGLRVLQPMLFETASRLVFRLSTRSGGKGLSAVAGLYPLDDRELVPVLGDVEALSEVTAAVPCILPAGVEGDLSVSAYLIDSGTGAKVPAEFVLKGQEKRGNARLLTLGLPPSAVKPGTYVLYVNVRIPGTDAVASGRTSFTVAEMAG